MNLLFYGAKHFTILPTLNILYAFKHFIFVKFERKTKSTTVLLKLLVEVEQGNHMWGLTTAFSKIFDH